MKAPDDRGGAAAMTQEEAVLRAALQRLAKEVAQAVGENGPPPLNFNVDRLMSALRAARAVLDGNEPKVSPEDQELDRLMRFLRACNADDGNPDPALEFLVMLIERDKPHRVLLERGGGL